VRSARAAAASANAATHPIAHPSAPWGSELLASRRSLTTALALSPVVLLLRLSSSLLAASSDAYAIASICGILATMDPATTEFRNTKDLIKTWAAEVSMPPELKLKMLEYVDESQLIIRQRYYGRLLELLSPTLRGAAAHHVVGSRMRNVSFLRCDDCLVEQGAFEGDRGRRVWRLLLRRGDDARSSRAASSLPGAFETAIAQQLQLRIYGQGERICNVSEPATELFVIVKVGTRRPLQLAAAAHRDARVRAHAPFRVPSSSLLVGSSGFDRRRRCIARHTAAVGLASTAARA
jgi:hypothetical protein